MKPGLAVMAFVLVGGAACPFPVEEKSLGSIDGATVEGDGGTDAGILIALDVIALSAGHGTSCALLSDRTARCWGRNSEGQLGDGTTSNRDRPVAVSGLTNLASISIGYEHACASREDGTAWCWGNNPHGQLGTGDANIGTGSMVPVQVRGLTNVSSIHVGAYQTCARLNDGAVSCWGRGGYLGTNSVANSGVPATIPGLTGVVQLSVSTNSGASLQNHVCGRRTNGTVFCWGLNGDGQLGDGTQNDSQTPVEVVGITDAVEVTAGGSHACARRMNWVSCWGSASGDGTFEPRLTPTTVLASTGYDAIEAGDSFTIALRGATLLCWGSNASGQCGNGASLTADGPIYPGPMPSRLDGSTVVAAGDGHTCAYVASSMSTWCWGSNEWGQLGHGPGSLVTATTPDFVRW